MYNYVQILKESLVEKRAILTQLEQKSKEQSSMIASDDFTLEEIDKNMDEKEKLIEKLERLDLGFDNLYEKIKTELVGNKDKYKEQIGTLQKLISQIMEQSASIEAIEARNKKAMEERFNKERKQLQVRKNASDAAYHYYKSANKLSYVNPQFLDQKK